MASNVFEILSPQHFEEVLAISEVCFGQNYLTQEQLENYSGATNLSVVYRLNGKLIGFCLNEIYLKSNRKTAFSKSIKQTDFPAGIIKTIAITPKLQQKGYGSKLLDLSVSKLAKQSIKSIYYPAWNETECDRFFLKLKKIEFNEITVIPDYWSRESVKNNYYCARCGAPPCHCSLSLFRKQV
jgi:N-acetylglutamate synthase-like GNAT family acetyltransferase